MMFPEKKNKDIRRVFAGYKAKARGSGFEKQFKVRCNLNNVAYIHLPQMGAEFKRNLDHEKRTIPCDFIIGHKNMACLIDTKSVDADRLSYSEINSKSFRLQVIKLTKFQADGQGISVFRNMAGFVVYFKQVNLVYFFQPKQLFNVNPKSSIKFSQGLRLGTYINFNPVLIFYQELNTA